MEKVVCLKSEDIIVIIEGLRQLLKVIDNDTEDSYMKDLEEKIQSVFQRLVT